jgi:hypothetical protein
MQDLIDLNEWFRHAITGLAQGPWIVWLRVVGEPPGRRLRIKQAGFGNKLGDCRFIKRHTWVARYPKINDPALPRALRSIPPIWFMMDRLDTDRHLHVEFTAA